jgi:hypothetical protein
LNQEIDNKILVFAAKFKETYKCPECGKKIKFWPFVVNGECPFCGKPVLKKLMQAGEIAFECQKCEAPITSFETYITDYCTKCYGSPGGIPFKNEAYTEAQNLSPYRLFWVKCNICGRKIETRKLEYGGVFPLAGFCKKCNKTICWNCASMYFAAGIWEANEITALARAGNLIALHSMDGKTVAPKCPLCNVYLDSIVNQPEYSTFKLIKAREVNPLK